MRLGDKNMKIECYVCGKEYDKESDDIIYKVIASSFSAIFYGFVCRDCKNKEEAEKRAKEQRKREIQAEIEQQNKNKKWWQL